MSILHKSLMMDDDMGISYVSPKHLNRCVIGIRLPYSELIRQG